MFGVHKMVKHRLKILQAFVARFLMCTDHLVKTLDSRDLGLKITLILFRIQIE